jgi:hypothetical protein
MMFDAGIDWQRVIQNEQVPLLFAAPFLDEAGWLFQAGADMWPGRVRSGQLRAFGRKLNDMAFNFRRNGLAWAAGGMRAQHAGMAANVVLGQSARRRNYRSENVILAPDDVPKVLAAAVWLTQSSCRELVDKLRQKEAAEKLEDELEILCEAPCFGREAFVEVTGRGLILAQNRALQKACANLSSQAASVLYHHLKQTESYTVDDDRYRGWSGQAEHFGQSADETLVEFVASLRIGPALTDMKVDDTDYHYERHFGTSEEVNLAVSILGQLVHLLEGAIRRPEGDCGLPQIERVVDNLAKAGELHD